MCSSPSAGGRPATDPFVGETLGQSTLRGYPAYLECYRTMPSRRKGESASPVVVEADEAAELASSTPIDRIDAVGDELTAAIEDRVYTALHQIEDPYDFEHLVTGFVARLGYGEEYEVTARSGDGGSPGQRGGCSCVHRKPGSASRVGRGDDHDIHLCEDLARGGRAHAQHQHHVDRRAELARLMVKYDIGVTVERTIAIKRLDPSQLFVSSEIA